VRSVFISYRREDTEGQARALFQDLVLRLGRNSVFMDVDSIALGRDFREVLQERLASCDLMLALIGKDWLDGKDRTGRRRLENPGDFVRLEIAAALKRNIPVTPLLLQGAKMPVPEQLPEDIRDLAFRNGFELSHNRWESDVQELVKRLALVAPNEAPLDRKAIPNKPWLTIAGVSAVAVAVALAGFLYFKKSVPENSKTEIDSSVADRKPTGTNSADKRWRQGNTHYFNSPEFQLSISNEGRYISSPFTVDNLDPSKDFVISFQIKSTRNGGSTRYGIAWNYSPEDFLLFTIHSTAAGYFSIGPGRSRTYAPFSRLSQGYININAEHDFDTLQISKIGSTLVFAINEKEVWRTSNEKLTSNQFAFWVADFSDAVIKSYTVYQ